MGGRWYNIANLPTSFQFEGNTCGTADYTLRPDNVVTVRNSEKMNFGILAWFNIRQSATGAALKCRLMNASGGIGLLEAVDRKDTNFTSGLSPGTHKKASTITTNTWIKSNKCGTLTTILIK